MKRFTYIIPTEVELFIDFESIIIYLLHVCALEWSIPEAFLTKVIAKHDQFEHVFFQVIINKSLQKQDVQTEFQLVWLEYQLLLTELYNNYLLNNEAINADYKAALSIVPNQE